MKILLLYILITVIGCYIGSFLHRKNRSFAWSGRIQTAAIIVMVFTMGSRIGSSEEIISSLGSIGLQAFTLTLAAMAGSVFFVSIFRRVFRFDRYGRRYTETQRHAEALKEAPVHGSINTLTILIVVFVGIGIIAGHFFLPRAFLNASGTLLTVFLCILLLFIGIDIGTDGTLIGNFRNAGWRVIVFPFAAIFGSLLAAALLSILLPFTVKDSLCIVSGLGWYSLAPAMLAEYSVKISALSFMHNVMRELLGMLLIPVAARHIGHIESYSLPGSPSMDVCLPIIERATSSDIAVYSFVCGAMQSAAVPFLVSLCMAL